MKNYLQHIKPFVFILSLFMIFGCVHDDKYDDPDSEYQCQDLTATMTLAELKAQTQNVTFTSDDVIEGYVSSSDETGNIYKYIYIQDKPENPTQGLVISVNATSTYANYPQGAKVYIKLNGLALGTYGNFVQLGAMDSTGEFGRIPEADLPTHMFRSCTEKATIVPKVMTLSEMKTANDQYVGCLVEVDNAEFDDSYLCMQYAPEAETVNRQLNDPTSSTTTKVVRNSGYASFANKTLPSGNGKFVGILSKYSSTYQLYIVRDSDLEMTGDRLDGLTATCQPDESATSKTVAEVKAYYNGSLTQISDNATLTAKVTGNDESGNLYKYIYVEDETGGLRVNINLTEMYLDRRFQIGRTLTIGLKDLYINKKNGELQLGGLYSGNVGQVEKADVYKHFFKTDNPITTVTSTVKTIETLTEGDVGKYITIKNLQFIDADLGKAYASSSSSSATSRTLEDCSGNTISLTTSGYADFGTDDYPLYSYATEVDTGKGDVTGILTYYNGSYQIWILNLRGADLDNVRCDGTLPAKTETIYEEGFSTLNNWTAISLEGSKVWSTTNYGNPSPSAYMSGYGQKNDDWLVSSAISLSGYTSAYFSFETDGRYSGNALEVYVTDNFTGDVSTTSWTKLDATFDTDMSSYGGFVDSGKLSLDAYAGKSVYIAFRYTSTSSAATNWELDNVLVKGSK